MRSCRDIAKLASESLDHELTWSQKLSLWFHAKVCSCPICKKFFRQITLCREASRELGKRLERGQTGEGQGLSEQARDRIQASIKNSMSLPGEPE